MRKILSVTFLFLFTYSIANATNNLDTPVMVGGTEDLDACHSEGIVSGLDPEGDAFLAVRAAANANARMLDKLPEGKKVYICDSSPDGKWLGIVYTKKGIDCGVSSPIRPAQPYKGRCHSGWVSQKWVKVTAG